MCLIKRLVYTNDNPVAANAVSLSAKPHKYNYQMESEGSEGPPASPIFGKIIKTNHSSTICDRAENKIISGLRIPLQT